MPDTNPVPASVWDVHQPSTRRSLILCGVGALAGLLIAGFGLFTAQGTRTFVVPPEDAAIVNTVPLLMTDYIGQITAAYNVPFAQATPAQKRKILDDMIREEIYAQRGVELGLPADDIDVRQALVAGTEAVVAQDAMTELPGDADLRGWYDTHRDRYSSEGEMRLQEFVLPRVRAGDAGRVVAALRGGASPASLNLKSSGRTDDGDEFYFAAKAHLGDRIFAVARALNDGAISDAIPASDGAHILVMNHNQAPRPSAYEAVHDRVLHDYLDAKVSRLQAGNERFLRKRADIRIATQLQ